MFYIKAFSHQEHFGCLLTSLISVDKLNNVSSFFCIIGMESISVKTESVSPRQKGPASDSDSGSAQLCQSP